MNTELKRLTGLNGAVESGETIGIAALSVVRRGATVAVETLEDGSRVEVDVSRPNESQWNAALEAAVASLRAEGFDARIALSVQNVGSFKLADGETARVEIASAVLKTSPDPIPDAAEPEPLDDAPVESGTENDATSSDAAAIVEPAAEPEASEA